MDKDPVSSDPELLSRIVLDSAKFGVLLYLCGLFAFSFYHARFRILSIDLAKPEAILIGFYIFVLFALLPWVLDNLFRKRLERMLLRVIGLSLILGIIDYTGLTYLAYKGFFAIAVTILTLLLQLVGISSLAGFSDKASLVKRLQPLGVLFVCCIQFSFCWLPRIPAYYGGGQPYMVQVFTKTPDLPANRFFQYKNNPQINKSIDSFKLRLLYETDKDVYFIDELRAGSDSIGYSVMKIKRDEILRMDYETPKWLRW